MSDLLIHNFDPPKYGYREIRIHSDGRVTEVDECGIDEVVGIAKYISSHGRLGDLDDLKDFLYSSYCMSPYIKGWQLSMILEEIREHPTIIPASE